MSGAGQFWCVQCFRNGPFKPPVFIVVECLDPITFSNKNKFNIHIVSISWLLLSTLFFGSREGNVVWWCSVVWCCVVWWVWCGVVCFVWLGGIVVMLCGVMWQGCVELDTVELDIVAPTHPIFETFLSTQWVPERSLLVFHSD